MGHKSLGEFIEAARAIGEVKNVHGADLKGKSLPPMRRPPSKGPLGNGRDTTPITAKSALSA